MLYMARMKRDKIKSVFINPLKITHQKKKQTKQVTPLSCSFLVSVGSVHWFWFGGGSDCFVFGRSFIDDESQLIRLFRIFERTQRFWARLTDFPVYFAKILHWIFIALAYGRVYWIVKWLSLQQYVVIFNWRTLNSYYWFTRPTKAIRNYMCSEQSRAEQRKRKPKTKTEHWP